MTTSPLARVAVDLLEFHLAGAAGTGGVEALKLVQARAYGRCLTCARARTHGCFFRPDQPDHDEHHDTQRGARNQHTSTPSLRRWYSPWLVMTPNDEGAPLAK